jgi:hypothetical protein
MRGAGPGETLRYLGPVSGLWAKACRSSVKGVFAAIWNRFDKRVWFNSQNMKPSLGC